MSIPNNVREKLWSKMWGLADQIGWADLSLVDKNKYYLNWTRDPKIGGVIAQFIEKERVRVYLKDRIMKEYTRARKSDPTRAARIRDSLGIDESINAVKTYDKPPGQELVDGRVICWGKANNWKTILMALHERVYARRGIRPFAAVLTQASGRFQDSRTRSLVEDAARKLAVEKVVWLDT